MGQQACPSGPQGTWVSGHARVLRLCRLAVLQQNSHPALHSALQDDIPSRCTAHSAKNHPLAHLPPSSPPPPFPHTYTLILTCASSLSLARPASGGAYCSMYIRMVAPLAPAAGRDRRTQGRGAQAAGRTPCQEPQAGSLAVGLGGAGGCWAVGHTRCVCAQQSVTPGMSTAITPLPQHTPQHPTQHAPPVPDNRKMMRLPSVNTNRSPWPLATLPSTGSV
jgi:hypothetical protein